MAKSLPLPKPIHLEPHTLAGFCNQADHLEEVLGHTDWQDDEALEARRESFGTSPQAGASQPHAGHALPEDDSQQH